MSSPFSNDDWAARQDEAACHWDDADYARCDGCGLSVSGGLYDCQDDGRLCRRCYDRAAEAYFRKNPHLLDPQGELIMTAKAKKAKKETDHG